MDFEVTINGEKTVVEQFDDMIGLIKQPLAQWNNFDPEQPMVIEVKKIPGQAATLAVSVDDGVMAADIFGGLPPGVTEEDAVGRG